MTYSIDLRQRAVAYVRGGGSQAQASRLFKVTSRSLYSWLKRDDLSPKPHGSRHRKLDKAALAAHVRDHPDALLRERAVHFNVSVPSLWAALRKMNIVKKND
jgi:transposase